MSIPSLDMFVFPCLVAVVVGVVSWLYVKLTHAEPDAKRKKYSVSASKNDGAAPITKKNNKKGRPMGDLRGRAPDRVGEEGGFRKLIKRKEQELDRAKRRKERGGEAVKMVDILWKVIHEEVFEGRDNGVGEEKKLKGFYNSAIRAEVTVNSLDGIVDAYTIDKFASRADEAACMYLYMHKTHPEYLDKPAINMASVGGGPGNDAVGYLIFNEITKKTPVSITVYDFVPTWGPIVDAVSGAIRESITAEFSLNFTQCDLQQPPTTPINSPLLASLPTTDLITFIYCLHESSALNFTLFESIIHEAAPGCVVVVIEVFEKVVDGAVKVAAERGWETTKVPKTAATPFNAAYMRKVA